MVGNVFQSGGRGASGVKADSAQPGFHGRLGVGDPGTGEVGRQHPATGRGTGAGAEDRPGRTEQGASQHRSALMPGRRRRNRRGGRQPGVQAERGGAERGRNLEPDRTETMTVGYGDISVDLHRP